MHVPAIQEFKKNEIQIQEECEDVDCVPAALLHVPANQDSWQESEKNEIQIQDSECEDVDCVPAVALLSRSHTV